MILLILALFLLSCDYDSCYDCTITETDTLYLEKTDTLYIESKTVKPYNYLRIDTLKDEPYNWYAMKFKDFDYYTVCYAFGVEAYCVEVNSCPIDENFKEINYHGEF